MTGQGGQLDYSGIGDGRFLLDVGFRLGLGIGEPQRDGRTSSGATGDICKEYIVTWWGWGPLDRPLNRPTRCAPQLNRHHHQAFYNGIIYSPKRREKQYPSWGRAFAPSGRVQQKWCLTCDRCGSSFNHLEDNNSRRSLIHHPLVVKRGQDVFGK